MPPGPEFWKIQFGSLIAILILPAISLVHYYAFQRSQIDTLYIDGWPMEINLLLWPLWLFQHSVKVWKAAKHSQSLVAKILLRAYTIPMACLGVWLLMGMFGPVE